MINNLCSALVMDTYSNFKSIVFSLLNVSIIITLSNSKPFDK